ncbi:hypothetical protein FKM82_021540 [Ascaphus truei]
MLQWDNILLLAISFIECTAGSIFNSCIMAVSYRNWKKDISRNLCDLILLSMGLSNIFLQCTLSTLLFLSMVQSHKHIYRDSFLAMVSLQMFLLFLSFWLTTWLCVYYCTKIANFTHRLFFRLKLWIISVLQKLLLMSMVGSFIISVPSLWICHQIHPQENRTQSLAANCSGENEPDAFNLSFMVIAAVLGCCLPYLLSFISIGITLTSLWGHVCRMKQNASDFSIPRLQVHSRAARNMILLVVLSMSVCIIELFILFSPFGLEKMFTKICLLFIQCYPTAQAFLLIQGNTKLRRVCQRILHCIKPLRAS